VALGGWLVNFQADRILINLRADGFDGYRIPYGGAFRWVSAANYFGEIILWAGWALMAWTLPGLIFVLFSIANLLPRALSIHRWYRETFPDEYPRERKAIVPGLL
jgi:3-oxo-5-alpha-steroid 4-dehydrogenase 1